jgi:hypothetical protein
LIGFNNYQCTQRYLNHLYSTINTKKIAMKPFALQSLAVITVLCTSTLALAQNNKDVTTKAAAASSSSASSNHYWYDGAERKSIALDSSRVVRFAADGKTSILAKALSQEKSVGLTSSETESPLFVENGRRRALPGGLIVSLKQARDAQDAREQLMARGLTPVRMIQGDAQGRNWIVASPSGLETLTIANRLHESGVFASVSPNWWTELSKK